MTNNAGTINSTYQARPTSFALALGIVLLSSAWEPRQLINIAHTIVNALGRKADRLAPRFSDECGDSSCTNLRPGADQPRRQTVWDLHAEALTWNLIADEPTLVTAALAGLLAGQEVSVGSESNGGTRIFVTAGETTTEVTDKVWDECRSYEAAGKRWATSGGKVWESTSEPRWGDDGQGPEDCCCDTNPGECEAHAASEDTRTAHHVHTDVEGNRYETHVTSQLRPGDVVINYGMVILLVDRKLSEVHTGPVSPVYVLDGYVLNPSEAREIAGNLLYTWDDYYSISAARWTIQGNDLAAWNVLAAGPRLEALCIPQVVIDANTRRWHSAHAEVLAGETIEALYSSGNSLELSLAATTLAYGTDPSRLPSGVLRRRPDPETYSAERFCQEIAPERTEHLRKG